jgi:outer membrane protein assembly factor BamA
MQILTRISIVIAIVLAAPGLFAGTASDTALDTASVHLDYSEPLPREIRAVLNTVAAGAPADELESALAGYLFQFGYFSARIARSEESDTLRISPGVRAAVRTINFSPDDFPKRDAIRRQAEDFIGDAFSQPETELWIASVLESFERDGRPFARIRLDSVAIGYDDDAPVVDLFLSFSETGEVTLHRIEIDGNTETRDRTVYRQAGVFPGDRYSRERIDAIRPRLMRSGLFRSVAEPELRVGPHGGVLQLRVEESRFNSFDGIVGYVPSGAGDGYFTGLAHITMRNLFGTMRRFEFRWQRETEFTQELFFKYREPYVGGLPANVTGSFRQRQQDSSFVQTRTRLVTDTEILRQFVVGLSYEYESVIPAADLQVQRVRRSTSNLFGIDLQYDTRDDIYAPRGGMFYLTEYQSGRIRRGEGTLTDSQRLQRLTIDAELYFSPLRQQVVKVGVYGREVRLGDYQESDLFRFGGTRSLRGYSEGQFHGSRLAWSNLEYRLMSGRRSYVFGFFDSGYYYVPQLTEGQQVREAFEYGYGAGLQVETGIGLISIGFGFGRGDTFSTGKIHFGVINEF